MLTAAESEAYRRALFEKVAEELLDELRAQGLEVRVVPAGPCGHAHPALSLDSLKPSEN